MGTEKGRRPVPLDHLRHPLGSGPFAIENNRGTQAQACAKAVAERVGEKQFGRGVDAILRAESKDIAREIGAGNYAALRVHDRLGRAGGARSVDPHRRGFFRQFGSGGGGRRRQVLAPLRFDDQLRPVGDVREQPFQQGARAFVAPDETRVGLRQHHRQFALEQPRVEADGDTSRPDRAEVGDDPGDAVRCEYQHTLPLLETARAPGACGPPYRGAQLAIAQALRAAFQRGRASLPGGEQISGGVHVARGEGV